MAKYHIKDDGTPAVCRAQSEKCPKRDEDGAIPEHFEGNASDAREWAEQKNAEDAAARASQERSAEELSSIKRYVQENSSTQSQADKLLKQHKKMGNSAFIAAHKIDVKQGAEEAEKTSEESAAQSTESTSSQSTGGIKRGSPEYHDKLAELRKEDEKYSSGTPSSHNRHFRALGVAEPKFSDGVITLTGKNGREVNFQVDGDCCSSSFMENYNVSPVDSPVKSVNSVSSIPDGAERTGEREVPLHDRKDLEGSGEFKENFWEIEYENGEKQYFSDINISNGYYSNIGKTKANFKLTEAFQEDLNDGDAERWA